jgi:hypothetical protein
MSRREVDVASGLKGAERNMIQNGAYDYSENGPKVEV